MDSDIRNAKITKTQLGIAHTDHGILSFYIMLDYGGAGQGFGGWCLDTNNPGHVGEPYRLPTILGTSLLLAIDRVFHVDWEGLPGQPCRAYSPTGDKLHALGHFLKDDWFWIQEKGGEYEFVVTKFEDIAYE